MSIGVSFATISDVANVEHKDLTGLNQGTDLDYDCEIKQPCDITNPVFILQTDTDLKLVNYAFCRSFSRYYFVTEVSLTPQGWVLTCATDVLTTAAKLAGLDSIPMLVTRTNKFDGTSNLITDQEVTTLNAMRVNKYNFSKTITQADGTGTNYLLITA